ncbi:ethanolamine ammonia-lyase, light subunit [Leptospira yanagawae serovar Saopaulo str. Sao Paulo = ATCC 700523]|uniref:Ethanolamine ammonia-lyase small subunit n=1 Tax=Leptospira yanagawae serovar Saopaulo str. Sao Paulo = ATCC 700523 TaxID=1249483 RepID=A0A5E8H7B5_9LEPT|nr:ethanolamine ammonia-lyase subunit EutC [Leptospira yanagawae]EOQ87185.1 ethanolamine ammonia-lyase, light subunit [Leptospira yanagawae serovar Saopaulo str. Sao Paulo = ATCC 700523]
MSSLEKWKQFTQARIGLNRSGGSISTNEMLKFRLDHAKAKDAVLLEPNWELIEEQTNQLSSKYGIKNIFVKSKVSSKQEYLLRPDLGRSLLEGSNVDLIPTQNGSDLSIVCIDGLSAEAIDENLIPFLELLFAEIQKTKLNLSPLVIAKWGRVALGDEIAERLRAKICLVIIGERPGLSAADSLGIYLTYEPKLGNTDESRNCISNVRPMGLPIPLAVKKTMYLIQESLAQKKSGVLLKDQMPNETHSLSQEKVIPEN